MSNLPNAGKSPEIVSGVLKWYAGDIFSINLNLDLTDQFGGRISLSDSDNIIVIFYDNIMDTVKQFAFNGITDNVVTLDFDSDCTSLFDSGNYTYDIILSTQTTTITIAKSNPVVVM